MKTIDITRATFEPSSLPKLDALLRLASYPLPPTLLKREANALLDRVRERIVARMALYYDASFVLVRDERTIRALDAKSAKEKEADGRLEGLAKDAKNTPNIKGIDDAKASINRSAKVAPKNKAEFNKALLLQILASTLNATIQRRMTLPFTRLINATGVVLQTNFGRALFDNSVSEIVPYLTDYIDLEYDLDTGKRGARESHVGELLCALLGCEDALVVNNNAAAVLLCVSTFAKKGRSSVLISRGELIEIGGSFRIPEVIRAANARLVEVGTTNKTHLKDYANSITPQTSMIIKAHKSNFAQSGFVTEVALKEIIALAREHDLVDYYDLGGGYLGLGMEGIGGGIEGEPSLEEIFALSPSLVSFSGDKLFGSVQAGIIAGKKSLIDKLRKNHLLRALRMDKLGLLALGHSLSNIYKNKLPPTTTMLTASKERLRQESIALLSELDCEELRARENLQAKGLLEALRAEFIDAATFYKEIRDYKGPSASLIKTSSIAGGGTLPTHSFASYGVGIHVKRPTLLLELLREQAVIARIESEIVIFDMRTLTRSMFCELASRCNEALNRYRAKEGAKKGVKKDAPTPLVGKAKGLREPEAARIFTTALSELAKDINTQTSKMPAKDSRPRAKGTKISTKAPTKTPAKKSATKSALNPLASGQMAKRQEKAGAKSAKASRPTKASRKKSEKKDG